MTFADIHRALMEHPDQLYELREPVLTEELLKIPQKLEELIERVEKLEKGIEKIERYAEFFKQDATYLEGEFDMFKEIDFERTIRERYYAYFGRVLKRPRRVDLEGLLPLIEELEEKGVLDERQSESLLQLDLIVEGRIKKTDKEVVLAVEISYSVCEEDLERAKERADILAHVLKKEVIPAIVGVEVSEELAKRAEEEGILLIRTNY